MLPQSSKSVVKSELETTSVAKWQREWDLTTKGQITKAYFPVVAQRLNMKINLTRNFTTMVTDNGNINSYMYRFKISDTPKCPCGNMAQIIDHLLFECDLLKKERDNLISAVSKPVGWPINKHTLMSKHYRSFLRFTNQISFDKLNE